jgi:hypothetical protein
MAILSNAAVNTVPFPIPLGLTTVNSVNPNVFGVYLMIAGGTVTNVTVNGVSQGTVVAGTFLVNPGANVNLTYTVAPTTFRTAPTGLPQANTYPFTDPVYQVGFTAQQNLTQPGVIPFATDA